MHRNRVYSASALGLSALLLLGGCGTGEYQNRMAKRAETLEFAGSFETNLRPESVVVNPDVSLRLPSIFNSDSKAYPNPAPPPVGNLPGLSIAYERFIAEGDKSFPFYCYFASTPIAENQTPEAFKAAVEADIAKSGAAGGKFAPVSVTGPSGVAQNWEMLSIRSPQTFTGAAGTPDASVEGRFDLYFRSTGKDFVLVGWRAPATAAAANKFFEDAKLAMGSAQVKETAPTTPPGGGPPNGS